MDPVVALIEELKAYQPEGLAEVWHYHALLRLLQDTKSPLSCSQIEPGHVTASCFIVVPSKRQLLLHHHLGLDRWLQMGGHIEENETVLGAALREASEESGLTDLVLMAPGVFDIDVHPIPALHGKPAHLHYDVRFLTSTRTPAAIIMNSAESSEIAWFLLEDAACVMVAQEPNRALQKIGRLL